MSSVIPTIYQLKILNTSYLLLLLIFLGSCQAVKENGVQQSVEQLNAVVESDNTTAALTNHSAHTLQHQQPEWMTIVERGNNEAKNKQWGIALQFYNQALDLMDNPIATPQAPSSVQIKKVLRLASQAQLLANSSENGTRSILDCNTMMRSQVRGFQIRKHLIPVQFEFGKTSFSDKGKESARQLAECLRQRQRNDGLSKVELVGHTDKEGSYEFNDKLSLKRAEALKQYLDTEDITVDISTSGKGERQPLQLENPDNYTQAEIDELNRRVEVITQ